MRCILLLIFAFLSNSLFADETRFNFQSQNNYLSLEFWGDDFIHFEYGVRDQMPSDTVPIRLSPMLSKTTFSQPSSFQMNGNEFKTAQFRIYVNPQSLCFDFGYVDAAPKTTFCPQSVSGDTRTISFQKEGFQNIYGLGQRFRNLGSSEGDWNHQLVASGTSNANNMHNFAGGAVGETQFPVMYALDQANHTFFLFIDSTYSQSWDFRGGASQVAVQDTTVGGFVSMSKDIILMRQKYMDLVGRPPVPPKKMFGFWLSEYGYENWDEVAAKLTSMVKNQFPIDGFFLDLQWFGNVAPMSDNTNMGRLQFDESKFPNPKESMKYFKDKYNIAFIPIEESYVGRGLNEYNDLESRGYLAHECGNPKKASYLTASVHGNSSEWWGRGGMLDWSNPQARAYWHKTKREPLVNMGMIGHWLDLGEPEMYDKNACYYGVNGRKTHKDIHNLFSFLWAQGIAEGYENAGRSERPFMMLRSGTAGMQRFGATLWSGDISGNLASLASHHNAGMHLSYAGMDYYSSDIGGFHRNRTDGSSMSDQEVDQSYTQWFAASSWFDIPFRAHTLNLSKDRETAPDRIGDVKSNLFNLKNRYQLIPYYYSLAHLANRDGLPIMAAMSMMHPEDKNLRNVGHQRYVGPYFMVALTAHAGETSRDVYLPKGGWYDYWTNEFRSSSGDWARNIAVQSNGIHRLATFVKEGALVPMAAEGKTDAARIRVYPGRKMTSFEMFDDDGVSQGYRKGEVSVTKVSQVDTFDQLSINVSPTIGVRRLSKQIAKPLIIEIVTRGREMVNAKLNGNAISDSNIRFRNANLIEIRLEDANLTEKKQIEIDWR